MNRCLAFILLFAGASLSMNAGTVYIGFKDHAGATVDYDYNDLVFAVSSPTLEVQSNASWTSTIPTLTADGYSALNAGLQDTPYWNNASLDGPKYNIGWCIYGGGNCNGGVGLSPNASYLTGLPPTPTSSPNDVTFMSSDPVTVTLLIHIAGSKDYLGWYDAAKPGEIHPLGNGSMAPAVFTFQPTAAFGLQGFNEFSGETFYSQTAVGGTQDAVSHFAYFSTVDSPSSFIVPSSFILTPEPGTFLLLLPAAVLTLLRRRK